MAGPNAATPLLAAIPAVSRSALLWRSGAILTAVGMLSDAFGTHGLRGRSDITEARLNAWQSASRYAIYNGIALLAISMHPRFAAHRFAGPAIIAGVSIFSGSIVALVLGGDRFKWMGPVTPIGGMAMIAGYISLAL